VPSSSAAIRSSAAHKCGLHQGIGNIGFTAFPVQMIDQIAQAGTLLIGKCPRREHLGYFPNFGLEEYDEAKSGLMDPQRLLAC